MKPPDKTVTLINLDGSLVFPADMQHEDYMRGSVLFALNSEQGWYTIEFSAGFSRQVIGLEDNTKISEGRDNVIFLNDQLTFIRNKMWETLAIYQTTLGRYTEVPWYDPKVLEPKHEQNYNVRALDEYDLSKGYFDQEYTDLEGCQYCANAKEFTWAMFVHEHLVIGLDENVPQEITAMAIQPMLEDFIKYYPDVFSKLTPLEGE